MSREQLDTTPIESRGQLVAALESGAKPRADWRIGTEHEKFGFYKRDVSPVPYDGDRGIRAVLEGMRRLVGWRGIYDDGCIIGLVDTVQGGAISLEPGGQFELSGAPLRTIHETREELILHLSALEHVAGPLGIGFLGLGASPKWERADVPMMPKSRSRIMAGYMRKVDALGLDMMLRSCTIQANLDFESEADMVKKARVSLAVQPIVTAIFATSPFLNGEPTGYLSYRSEIWRHTDPDRTGMLPFVFEENFGFERYVDWALDVPMYFVLRCGRYYDATDITFRQFLNGALADRVPDPQPNMGDWTNHWSTLFPEVRIKRFLEMRGADAGSTIQICALPAFWVGLLYDQRCLEAAWDLVRDWTAEERQALRDEVPKTALATPFRGQPVNNVAKILVDLAWKGLKSRAHLNDDGEDEAVFLAPIAEIVESGETSAEQLLRCYATDWHGDIDRVFLSHAY